MNCQAIQNSKIMPSAGEHPSGAPEGRREQGKKIEWISGCLWSFSQTPFSLPKQAQGVTGLKKLCCSSRKPGGNERDKAGAVNQTWVFSHVWYKFMEGLFY